MDCPAALVQARSWIFTPADSPHRLRRVGGVGAHCVIADLEDGVAPSAKAEARRTVGELYEQRRAPREPVRLLRVSTDPDHYSIDLDLAGQIEIDGIVVPKASSGLLDAAARVGKPVVALIETAAGVLDASSIAGHAGVVALMLGAADLAAELEFETREDGLELLQARSTLALASAAAGIRAPIDGVFLHLDDPRGLRRDAELARSLGMYGKACIHPRQLEAIDAVFKPAEDTVRQAERVVEAFDDALQGSRGVTLLDGQLIDLPIARRARVTLARAQVKTGGSQ